MEVKIVSIELKGPDLHVTVEGLPVDSIIIPLSPRNALHNRWEIYGLDNNEQALECIIREHAQRLNGMNPTDEGPNDKAKQLGGLRSDVTIIGEGAEIDEATRQAIWR